MRLLLVTVGHKMPDWITAGFNEYAKRMPREAKIELLEIKPEPRTTGKSIPQIMEAEAQRILTALPPNCLRIALGQPWTRLALILGAVALFTAASALVFSHRRLATRFALG